MKFGGVEYFYKIWQEETQFMTGFNVTNTTIDDIKTRYKPYEPFNYNAFRY